MGERSTPPLADPSGRSAHTPPSALLSQIVAIGGAALLIDAAVETVLAGSPLRWWPAGAVLLYAAVTALTWRRASAATWRIGLALAGILGVVAVTAWQPAGLTDGVRLFGQPTVRVVDLVAAAGVALAAYALLTAVKIPAIARCRVRSRARSLAA